MPTYEYACTACGNQWEELQKISEPALEDCPKCAAKTAKRLISGGTFILKGGGWYADLYASKPAKSGGEPGGGDSPAPSKEAGGGDAAKAPTKSGDAAASPAAPPAPAPAAAKASTGASGGSGGSSST